MSRWSYSLTSVSADVVWPNNCVPAVIRFAFPANREVFREAFRIPNGRDESRSVAG